MVIPDPETLLNLPGMEYVLMVDTHRCQYSKTLLNELKMTCRSKDKADPPVSRIRFVDVGHLAYEDLLNTWLPGFPCIVHEGKLHLGIDAFKVCRERTRSLDGVVLETYTDPMKE